MKIRDYYRHHFRGDLHRFMLAAELPYFGHGWEVHCKNLERVPTDTRAEFVFCLYFTVLVDQAMLIHFPEYYEDFEKVTCYPKFCHGLGQFHKKPQEILAGPIKQGLVSRAKLGQLLDPGMELFVEEVAAYFQNHQKDIETDIFLERLVSDQNVQMPLIFVFANPELEDDIQFLAYEALRKAVNKKLKARVEQAV